MRKSGLATLCLCSTMAAAVPSGAQMALLPAPQASQKSPPVAMPLDDMAWQMLVAAFEESKTASPAVHAQVALDFAKQLDQDNKKSDEVVVLREAYLATLEKPLPPYNTNNWIQGDILRAMMKNLGPEPVQELLAKMDEAQRGLAFDMPSRGIPRIRTGIAPWTR